MKNLIRTNLTLLLILMMNNMDAQKVVFGPKPFYMDGSSEQTSFSGITEIYGKITLSKPLKEYFTGKAGAMYANELNTENFELGITPAQILGLSANINYGSDAIEIKGQWDAVQIYITDLNSNVIYFDVIPTAATATTPYKNEIKNVITGQRSLYEKNKLNITISADEEFNQLMGLKGLAFTGSFTLDFTKTSEDEIYDLDSKYDDFKSATKGNIRNLKNSSSKIKFLFASTPFTADKMTGESTLKAGGTMYGRIVLEKPLKEYIIKKSYMNSDVYINKQVVDGIVLTCYKKRSGGEWEKNQAFTPTICVTQADLDKSVFDFDITTTKEAATTLYPLGDEAFRAILDPSGDNTGTVSYKFELNTQTSEMKGSYNTLTGEATFNVDYTGVSGTAITSWYDLNNSVRENVLINYYNKLNKESYTAVKSMGKPKCFSMGGGSGYSEYTKETITGMIKKAYGCTEVVGLTFEKTTAQSDFYVLNDANTNEPTCKRGSYVFFFAFKMADGSYRMAGGRLRMDHEGYGKYGAAYIEYYSPLQEGETFPYDYALDQKGIYSVFVFDGAKL